MAHLDDYAAALSRADERRERNPVALSARYDRRLRRVVVRLSTGLDVAFRPDDAQGLERATPDKLAEIEITPSGLGLHFPNLDADLYLPALLSGYLGSREFIASRLGVLGGKARTPAKLAASRANGRLGGRPRKSA